MLTASAINIAWMHILTLPMEQHFFWASRSCIIFAETYGFIEVVHKGLAEAAYGGGPGATTRFIKQSINQR